MSVHRRLARTLLRLAFPPLPLKQCSVHSLAATALQPHTKRCATPILAPLPYEHGQVRACVQAAKYSDNTEAATLLAAVLAPFLAEELAEQRLLGTFEKPLLIPIPLHKARLRERGFNQCERIASALVTHLGEAPPTLTREVLVRTRHTAQQSHLSRTQRQSNVRGAFHITAPELVSEQDVILLDDVVTTGSTLHEAMVVLDAAGAQNIMCVAVARAQ